jgi:outer membrane protein TolC
MWILKVSGPITGYRALSGRAGQDSVERSLRVRFSAIQLVVVAGILLSVSGAGCRAPHEIRDPEYWDLSLAMSEAWHHPAAVEAALNPSVPALAGPHPVEDYVAFGLAQNPQIQAARLRVESKAARVPQAASLQDPVLGITAHIEPVQTAAGQQQLAVTASQKIPWFNKLAKQAEIAEHEVQVARAQLAAAELDVVEKIKRAYYQLYFVQQAIRITEYDREQLRLIEANINALYRIQRKVSQRDVLGVQIELGRVETELVRLNQELLSARATLARLLHISPETEVRALDQLPSEQIPHDLDSLYRRAIAGRPELHASLASIQRDQSTSDLARLAHYPDVTLGMNWVETSTAGISPVSNGRDAFLLSASVNLPIYRRRLEAGVREAETKAVASARQYDAVKDETLQEVKDLFSRAQSQQQLLQLFREDLIPKAQQTLEQSIPAYEVGQVDFLRLIDSWRQLLQLQIGEQQLEAHLRQSIASLDRVLGHCEMAPLPDPASTAAFGSEPARIPAP